jgi:hypothetical protein
MLKSSKPSNVAYAVEKFPSRLKWYKDPPALDISLEDFENFAIDRLMRMNAFIV